MINYKTLFLASVTASAVLFSSCHKDDDDIISMDQVSKGIVKVMTIQGKDTIYIDAVDLGLPSELLWATCNIGANQPQETGNFYAWGETETKSDYNYATYVHCLGDDFSFIKYVPQMANGDRNQRLALEHECDNKKILDKTDDAASVSYGDKWFMPTKRDIDELIYRTSKKFGKLNGVNGILFTSNVPGYTDRSIFFPLSGRKDYDRIYNTGKYGFFWTSELSGTDGAYIMWLDNTVEVPNVSTDTRERSLGLPVRPITYK